MPVRSLKGAYVYETSPIAPARVKRLASLAGIEAKWAVPEVPDAQAQIGAGSAES